MRKKLRSEKGATLILALFALLTAVLLTAALLTSALNSLRLAVADTEAEQAYYALTSAQKAVVSCMGDLTRRSTVREAGEVSEGADCPGLEAELSENSEMIAEGGDEVIFPLIADLLNQLILAQAEGTGITREFTMESADVGDVKVTLELAADMTLSLTFSTEKYSEKPILYFRALTQESRQKESCSHEFRDDMGINHICTHEYEKTITEIRWIGEGVS